MLVGVDLQEGPGGCCTPPITMRQGVTAAFNLNLLTRINRELDGDFDLARFAHDAFYNAAAGRSRSTSAASPTRS